MIDDTASLAELSEIKDYLDEHLPKKKADFLVSKISEYRRTIWREAYTTGFDDCMDGLENNS